jgi:hypothetical protein
VPGVGGLILAAIDIGIGLYGAAKNVGEARRRLETWAAVADIVPSPQTVLSLVTSPADDPRLSRDEWALLALVDGRRTVGEIVALCGRGDFAVVSALADLVGRGLLRTDAGDDVAALTRRHEMLSRAEGRAVQVPAQPGSPDSEGAADAEPAPEPVVTDPEDSADATDIADAVDEPVADADGDDDASVLADVDVEFVAEHGAEVRQLSRAGAAARTPEQRGEITPRRPEPFLPKRQPEHPEDHTPVAAVAGGSAAPATVAHIERDPSVNKSLLLRLIAGVRGL